MADEDFKISADFSEAIKEFDKFAAVNTRLNNSMGSTLKIFPAYRRSSEESVRVIREMSKGTTKLTVEVLDLTKGYYELNKVTNRSRTEMGRIITDRVQIIKGIEAETKALKALQAQRQALNSSASASFGKDSWRGRSRPGDPSVFKMEADPNWEQQIASSAKERANALIRQVTLREMAFRAADRQAAANRAAYASNGPVYGPENNPNPVQPIQGAFSGIGHFIGRGAEIFALYHSIRLVTGAFENSTTAAKELTRQIGEIRTISQGTGVTFDQFKDQILSVSSAFGLAAEDVAEGTYQAISNQVVTAGNSMAFMAEEAKFARITQATLAEAVNLTSSALNAYSLDASHAAEVNAKMFKAVEVGRFRVKDIADSFGTVAVIANELGVNIDEVSAALAAMTVAGIKPANAMTYLRSLMTSLAKPSKELSEYLLDNGYASGQAAVNIETFTGFLAKLSGEAEGNIERMAELTPNVRGLQAALSLAGKNASIFADDLAKIKAAISSSNIAGMEIMSNASVKLDIQIQQLRNHFISLWMDILEGSTKVASNFNFLEQAANVLVATLVGLTARFVATKIQMFASTAQANTFSAALVGVQVAANGTKAAMISLAGYVGIAFFALTEAFLLLRSNQEAARQETERLISETFTKLNASINSDIVPAVEKISEKFRLMEKTLNETNRPLIETQRVTELYAKSLKEKFITALSDAISKSKESLNEFKKQKEEIDTLNSDSFKRQREMQAALEAADLNRRLAGMDPEEKKKALKVEIELAKKAAEEAAKNQKYYTNATEAERKENLEKARKEAAKVVEFSKQLSELQDEGITREKSAIQIRAENDAARKAKRIEEINRALKFDSKNVELQNEKNQLLKDEVSLKEVITAEEEKRLAATFNKDGTYENKTKTVRDAAKFQIDMEKTLQQGAKAEKENLEQIILLKERGVSALELAEKHTKALSDSAKDSANAFQLILAALQDISVFGDNADLEVKMKAAIAAYKEFDAVRSAIDAAENQRKEIQKTRELSIDIAQAETQSTTKTLSEQAAIVKGLAQMGSEDWRLREVFKPFQDKIARSTELERTGDTPGAALALQILPKDLEDIKFIRDLLSSTARNDAEKAKAQQVIGYLTQLTGTAPKAVSAIDKYQPLDATGRAFQKYRQLQTGAPGELTAEEFDLLKNSTQELKRKFEANNLTVEKMNESFKDTTDKLKLLNPILEGIINKANTKAAQAASVGVDITNKSNKSEQKQDVNAITNLTVPKSAKQIQDENLVAQKERRLKEIENNEKKYGESTPEVKAEKQALIDALVELKETIMAAELKRLEQELKLNNPNNVDATIEKADKKAGGGYARRPGIHGRGEMVINTGSTNKYRSLLEQLNRGDESFFIGQQGGRTGGYTSGQFLNKFGSIYLDGKLIPFHGDEGGLLYSGLRGRLFSEAVKYGGSTMDAIKQGMTISGMQYGSPWANSRQDYRTKAVSFGDINLKGDLGDRAGIAATVDTLMVEIRRRLSRQLGSL